MIEVEIRYIEHTTPSGKKSGKYIYTHFKVTGHSYGKDASAIKCCASVSAILLGMSKLVSCYHDKVVLEKGYFEYNILFDGFCERRDSLLEWDTQYGLNTCLCQLYEVYKLYPSFFSKFEMVEEQPRKEKL